MAEIKIDFQFSGLQTGFPELTQRLDSLRAHRASLHSKSCLGSEFLGWLDLPERMLEEISGSLFEYATRLREECDLVYVVGIGGSYLGAKAIAEALPERHDAPEVQFIGYHLCADALNAALQKAEGKRIGIIVISKSGTTLEPALSLRILLDQLGSQGAEPAPQHVIAITDANKGALRKQALEKGWGLLVVPDDVGGRYSVLSAVGLLPLAVMGIDIKGLLEGATYLATSYRANLNSPPEAAIYAAWRTYQYLTCDRKVELLATYTPFMAGIAEWYKQLFAESEGKEGKGVFPTSAIFTTDLHSLGQYFQQGHRLFFGTHLQFDNTQHTIVAPASDSNDDGLNYVAGKSLHEVNRVAQLATQQAHFEGGLPSICLLVPRRDAFHLGALIYFMEYACALSCLEVGVNPFDQPGVEAYKQHMFAQLGRPKQ